MRLVPELLVKVEKLVVYKCTRCPKVFPKESVLIKHKSIHDAWFFSHTLSAYVAVERAKIFQCDTCTLCFCTKRELMLHKLGHIQKNVRDERKAKRVQTKSNIVKPYKCPDCDYEFAAASTLVEHSILHKPFPHICECGIGYYKQCDLKSHIRLVHGSELKPTLSVPNVDRQIEEEEVLLRKTNATKGPSLKAVLVEKKKPAKKKWKVKIRDEDGQKKVQIPKRQWNIPNPNIDIRKTSDNQFECPECKKLFKAKRHVIIHYRVHTGERPFSCEICGKSFSQQNVLKSHTERHNAEKTFVCRYCDKAFTTAAYRARHEDIHSAVKKYKCSYCEKAFHDPSALLRHKRIHTGEKRYACPSCDKAFTDVSSLAGHKLRHHEKIKNFKCEICSKNFYTKDALNRHILVHSEERKYVCDYCKKCFSRKEYLKGHLERHAKYRRYKCDQCPRRFVMKQYLYIHILTVHNKVKIKSKSKGIFECNDCSQQFSFKYNLRRHYLQCHSGIQCDKCFQYFPSKTDLREHILENNESCEICNQNFFCVKMRDKHMSDSTLNGCLKLGRKRKVV